MESGSLLIHTKSRLQAGYDQDEHGWLWMDGLIMRYSASKPDIPSLIELRQVNYHLKKLPAFPATYLMYIKSELATLGRSFFVSFASQVNLHAQKQK